MGFKPRSPPRKGTHPGASAPVASVSSTLTTIRFSLIKSKPHAGPRNSGPVFGETSETVVWGLFSDSGGSPNQKEMGCAFSLPPPTALSPNQGRGLLVLSLGHHPHLGPLTAGAGSGHPGWDVIPRPRPCSRRPASALRRLVSRPREPQCPMSGWAARPVPTGS